MGAVRALLGAGAHPDGVMPGPYAEIEDQALHHAARACDIAVGRALIEAGASVDVLGSSRRTPLHWAARQAEESTESRCAFVRLLIDAGADVNAMDGVRSRPAWQRGRMMGATCLPYRVFRALSSTPPPFHGRHFP